MVGRNISEWISVTVCGKYGIIEDFEIKVG